LKLLIPGEKRLIAHQFTPKKTLNRTIGRSFYLRCWLEETGKIDQPYNLRFILVQLGQEHRQTGFISIEALFAHIQLELEKLKQG
jgi:hypothetical protein